MSRVAQGRRVIRTSERTTFKRCIQRWWWSYVEGLGPKGAPNRNLWFGSGIHLCLGDWYGIGTKRLVHPLETWEKWTEGSQEMIRIAADKDQIVESEWVDAIELGRKMLEGYLETYGEDESWEFIATEKSGRMVIPSFGSSKPLTYVYTFDGVYRNLDTGDVELLETKTAAAVSILHLTLDDQAGSYWAMASAELRKTGVLKGKDRIAGVNYNFLRKALPDVRPRHPLTGERCNKPQKVHYVDALSQIVSTDVDLAKLKLADLEILADEHDVPVYGEISANQPSQNFVRHMVRRTRGERNAQIKRIADESVYMDLVQDGTLPVTKTPRGTGHDACQYGCEFFALCELHEAGSDWEMYKSVMYKKRDPYEGYEGVKSAHMES